MEVHGQEPVPFENIQDEIFDMVKPMQPDRITLKDLLNWLAQGTNSSNCCIRKLT